MIYLYTGTVGSGKSYHALCEVLDALSFGRYVIANFPITLRTKKERKYFRFWEEFSVSDLIQFSLENGLYGREGSGLIVIDEAGVVFNCRDSILSKERKEWVRFFSQSRKFGYDVILVCQNERMLDRQIRMLAEFEVKHLKLNSYGVFRFIPFLTLFGYVTYWKAGNFRGSFSVGMYLPWRGKRYDTMRLFGYPVQEGGGSGALPSAQGEISHV